MGVGVAADAVATMGKVAGGVTRVPVAAAVGASGAVVDNGVAAGGAVEIETAVSAPFVGGMAAVAKRAMRVMGASVGSGFAFCAMPPSGQ